MRFAGRAHENVFNDIQSPPRRVHGAFGKTGRSGSIPKVKYIFFSLIYMSRFKIRLTGKEVLIIHKPFRSLILWSNNENILAPEIGKVVEMKLVEQLHTHKKACGVGVVDDVFQFRRNQAKVDRNRNEGGPCKAVIDFQEFDIVVHDDGNFILTFKSPFNYRVGKLVGPLIKYIVGNLLVLENRSDF